MVEEEDGRRKETLIQLIDNVTEIYSMANESSILAIRFINNYGDKENWTGESRGLLNNHYFGGTTEIGTELHKKILRKFAIGNPNQSKPLLVLIATDGDVCFTPKIYKAS